MHYLSVEEWIEIRKTYENEGDPVEIIKKVLLLLTKDEFFKIFWLINDHMVENYANKGIKDETK